MNFCTAISCMDGRIHQAVITYLNRRFGKPFVDLITEPGPNLILAEQKPEILVDSVLDRLKISVEKHQSKQIAIVGHHDCAGNPNSEKEQIEHLKKSIEFIKTFYPTHEIIGLWVDSKWQVKEIE